MTIIIFLLISISLGFAQTEFAYNPLKIDTVLVLKNQTSEIQLPQEHRIIEKSLNLSRNGNKQTEILDYSMDYDANKISFSYKLNTGDSLSIRYQIEPFKFRKSYTFLETDTLKQSKEGVEDSVQIRTRKIENPFADFRGNLKRSGSIVRGVRVGNNTDMTLNSGLNLQLSGYITDDVEIVAALTDESTPIQPEGNTQTLNEVDKVFIEFKSPYVKGTLGDFNLTYSRSAFGNLSRKLQGISLLGNYEKFELGGTVATTRGFFHNMTFIGQEGNQGPYQLLGKNGEREIIVLAGTEKVWINGEKMVRGESNDYIIEYGNGQITFTNRRLITSESRIEVDFEYYPALQQYTRNVYSAITTGKLNNSKLNYSFRYYREEDDPEQLLEAESILSEEEKQALRDAGDNQLDATVNGATFEGEGQGYYSKKDTVIDGENYSYFIYRGQNLGEYNVQFSSVGFGNGDYVRDRLGVYSWVGPGNGTYLPVKLLPLPVQQQMLDAQIQYKLTSKWDIETEYAVTTFDNNQLSSIDDRDNLGQALQLRSNLDNSALSVAGQKLGVFSAGFKTKYVEKYFQPVDRINQPDFNRYWNLTTSPDISLEENSLETDFTYKPVAWISWKNNLGFLSRQNLNSNRFRTELEWENDRYLSGLLKHEKVNTERQDETNTWLRQKGEISRKITIFEPHVLFESEDRKIDNNNGRGGFQFYNIGSRLNLIEHRYLQGLFQYNDRTDYIYDPNQSGRKIKQADTRTARFRLDLSEWNRLSGSIEFISRDKNFTPFFENTKVDSLKLQYVDTEEQDTVWQDRQTNLAELIINNHHWKKALNIRWQYKLSTEQLALREKVYLNVGDGRGNLRFDEELDEYIPDPDGKYVLFIIPSGNFEPVTNLQTSFRMQLTPDKYIKKPKNKMQSILKYIDSDSYIRIDEETKEKNLTQIYFLNLAKFQRDKTLRGSLIFNEDLHIMRRNRDLSFRLRYRFQKDRFNQYLDENENENRKKTERAVRVNYRLWQKIKVQSEIRQNNTFRNSAASPNRNRDINAWLLNQNFSWRPQREWEFGLDSEHGLEKDQANDKNLELRYHRGLFRANYSLLQKGRISSEFEYLNVIIENNPLNAVIPFEMARGKKAGASKRWQVRGEYTIAENVVLTLFYNGRDDAGFDKIIHTGQAEIRAYF